MSPSILDRMRETIAAHAMADPGARVLVAVSGGPDSVCLAHALRELGYAVGIAHFDHQTREGESAADAAFTRNLSEAWQVPFYFTTQPVAEEAAALGRSFEEYAREVRYTALLQMAIDHDFPVIATGHHAGDQAETVLMRVLRGTSPGGLAGIPPVRAQSGIRIIRPLIHCRRDEIIAYLTERQLEWCTDRTNADTLYLRNRVRGELLPMLRNDYNPKLDEALIRLAEMQREENEYLNGLTRTFLTVCCPDGRSIQRVPFCTAPVALQRRGLVLIGWRHGIETPFERIDPARAFILEASAGKSFDLGGGVLLRNSRDVTEILRGEPAQDDSEVVLPMPGEVSAFGRRFRIALSERAPVEPLAQFCNSSRQVFDADLLGPRLTLRLRRDGDRFTPLGMSGSRKLQDYFVDLGIPHGERGRIPLLVAGERIAWITGHATSAHMAVTGHTTRFAVLEVFDDAV